MRAKEEYHDVLYGDEWKAFLAEFAPFAKKFTTQIMTELLAIKITAMAVQKGVHPIRLPRVRNLISAAYSPEEVHPSYEIERNHLNNRATCMFRSDQGGSSLFVSNMFGQLCPQLVQRGVGHAGHVLEVAELVHKNALGSSSSSTWPICDCFVSQEFVYEPRLRTEFRLHHARVCHWQ